MFLIPTRIRSLLCFRPGVTRSDDGVFSAHHYTNLVGTLPWRLVARMSGQGLFGQLRSLENTEEYAAGWARRPGNPLMWDRRKMANNTLTRKIARLCPAGLFFCLLARFVGKIFLSGETIKMNAATYCRKILEAWA